MLYSGWSMYWTYRKKNKRGWVIDSNGGGSSLELCGLIDSRALTVGRLDLAAAGVLGGGMIDGVRNKRKETS